MGSADSLVDAKGFREGIITDQDRHLAQLMVYVRYARINNNAGTLEDLRRYLLKKNIPGRSFIAVGLDPRDSGNGEEMGGFAEGLGHLYRRSDRPAMVTDIRSLLMARLGKEAVVLLGSRGLAKLASVDEVMGVVGQNTWPVYLNRDHDWVRGTYGESLGKTLEVMTREAITLPAGLEFDSSQNEPLGAGNSLIYKLRVSKAGKDLGQAVALKVPKHKNDVLGNQLIANERETLEALKPGMKRDSVARPVWYWGDYSREGIEGMFLEWLDQDVPMGELVEKLAQANFVDERRLSETLALRILAVYNPLIYKAVHGDLVFDSAKFGLNLSNIMAVSLPGGSLGVRLVDFANSKKVGDFEDERKTAFARVALTEMQSLFRVAVYILSQGTYGGERQEQSYPLVGMMRRKGISENSWWVQVAEKMSVALNPNESIFDAYPAAIWAVTLASNNAE